MVEYLTALLRGLAAVPAGLLPRRYWERVLYRLPISRLALVSALLTFLLGGFIGPRGFLDYATRAAGAANQAMLEIAARQNAGQLPAGEPITTAAPVAFSILSLVAFALFTPLGLVATYLTISGFVRAVSSFVDEPFGDPILTGIDAVVRRLSSRAADASRRRAREREEGREVADRLYTGEWAGLSSVDYVVVAARRKPGWNAGAFVITSGQWYTLGTPFDLRLPEGLRTVYPLTEQRVNEVLRRGVAYELPPLERTGRRGGAVTRTS